jgi:hypothetical protein
MSIIPFVDAIAPFINKALAFIPDPEQRLKAEKELMDSLQSWDAQQVSINVEEAKHSNIFVSGWRPAVGWICVLALGWQFIGMPVGLWLAAIFEPGLVLPTIGDDNLFELMFGMLGLGGMRSYEKIKKVTK